MLPHGIVVLSADDEIDRNDAGSLVQELEEGMLAVRAGPTPEHRSRGVLHALAVPVHRLTVAFHVELLQVARQSPEVGVIGHDGMGVQAEKVHIPDAP
jgi:hypothetical protein